MHSESTPKVHQLTPWDFPELSAAVQHLNRGLLMKGCKSC